MTRKTMSMPCFLRRYVSTTEIGSPRKMTVEYTSARFNNFLREGSLGNASPLDKD